MYYALFYRAFEYDCDNELYGIYDDKEKMIKDILKRGFFHREDTLYGISGMECVMYYVEVDSLNKLALFE